MQVQKLQMAVHDAKRLWHKYLKDRHYETPVDREIRQAAFWLSKGKLILRALDSVVAAGLNEQGLPNLALCAADAKVVTCDMIADGAMRMFSDNARPQTFGNRKDRHMIELPTGSFPRRSNNAYDNEALVPIVPLHLRPKRNLKAYHILWEAEWRPRVARDPYLLRRIGWSDMWLVVAHWDLTPIEAAALQTRVFPGMQQ